MTRRILNPLTIALAWFVIAASFVHPPDGTGVEICLQRATSGYSCPGCGLCRSLSTLSRGDVAGSLAYHPFGFAIYGFFATVMVFSVLPGSRRRRVLRWMVSHDVLLRRVGVLLLVAFLLFGVGRTAAEWMAA